jgi:hypothetical protein
VTPLWHHRNSNVTQGGSLGTTVIAPIITGILTTGGVRVGLFAASGIAYLQLIITS